jgi:hypothetical protein
MGSLPQTTSEGAYGLPPQTTSEGAYGLLPNSVEQIAGFELQSPVRAQGSPATRVALLVMRGNLGFLSWLFFL